MTPIGFPPPSARFPILSETPRPAARPVTGPVTGPVSGNPAAGRTGGAAPADRPVRPDRPDHPHRTDRPARPDRPGEIDQRGRSELAHATRRFVHEAKSIMKNGGTMEDVSALADKILEKIPALEKFPPFQKLLKRIAYNLENNGSPPPVNPGPAGPTVAVASLTGAEPGGGDPEITVPPTSISIVV